MKQQKALAALLVVAISVSFGPARADVVADWNDIAMRVIDNTRSLPLEQVRALALMHTAMFDAVNAIQRKYRPYRFEATAPSQASPDVAAAAAASTVLLQLYPIQRDLIEINYDSAISSLPDGAAKRAGVDIGMRAAAALLHARNDDGLGAASTYRPHTQAGVYVPIALPIGSEWRKVRPWVMEHAAQFRPGPPPALSSARWARDYSESKQLGARASAARTRAQTDIARFWIVTGPPTAAGVTGKWTRIGDWVAEIDNARVRGGIHYRFSTEVGEALGRKVGGYAVATFLQPVPCNQPLLDFGNCATNIGTLSTSLPLREVRRGPGGKEGEGDITWPRY